MLGGLERDKVLAVITTYLSSSPISAARTIAVNPFVKDPIQNVVDLVTGSSLWTRFLPNPLE